MHNGTRMFVEPHKAVRIWEVWNDERPARDPREYAICERIKDIYLNSYTAPESYFRRYPERRPERLEPVRIIDRSRERWVPIETRKDLV